MGELLLGADLGTSALKLVALDPGGRLVAEAEQPYPLDRPRPGWAQIDVGVWRRAFDDALHRLLPALARHRVRGLGLAGQMHGAVLVDHTGAALAPALLWPDRRAAGLVDRWWRLLAPDRAALANPLAAGMTGPLAAWLVRAFPEPAGRAAAVLLPKDALRAALVPSADPRVTDRSDASGTLLWDVPGERWSAAAVGAAGLPPRLLPAVRPSADVVGSLPLAGTDVPVVVGGADTALALLAAGERPGVQVNLGTGAQVVRPYAGTPPAPDGEPAVHTYADVGEGWYAMAALQNGGSAWSWAAGVLGMTWDEFLAAADRVPAGAGGAAFRPFLTGERGGVAGPDERGSWVGLGEGTTRADLARAALEGVAFALAEAVALLGPPDDGGPVLLTGGGGRAAAVRRLLADVLGRPVRYVPLRSASAVGAALLAGRGAGIEVERPPEEGAVVRPRRVPELAAARERWRRATGTAGGRPDV